jgi:hypothetical protein
VLYALGQSPPVVMAEMGHTDPKLALRIYARAMRREPGEVERLRALAGVHGRPDWAQTGRNQAVETYDADRATSAEAVQSHP